MAVGLSDGTSFNDEPEWLASASSGGAKQFADAKEIGFNSTSGDFQSRFTASAESTMPPQASTELRGALESKVSSQTPENSPSTGNTFLDRLTGSGGQERYQTWPERFVRQLGDTADYIKSGMEGKVPTSLINPDTGEMEANIQTIEKANTIAGLMTFGPAPVAKAAAEGTLGSFAGVTSKTLDKTALYKAQEMHMDGMHPDDIWAETGFFQGADRRWRYEIPDTNMKLKDEGFDTILSDKIGESPQLVPKDRFKDLPENASLSEMFQYLRNGPGKRLTLGDTMDHPELYAAYPWLKDIQIAPMPAWTRPSIKGAATEKEIFLKAGSPAFIRSVLSHEVQHLIQRREGFARGGNQDEFLPPKLPAAEKLLEDAKTQVMPDIESKFKPREIDTLKWASGLDAEAKAELFNRRPEVRTLVAKAVNEGVFNQISNITRSERLLKDAKDEAYAKYQSLMGEVEARNVQARLEAGKVFPSPRSTEDIARGNQIYAEHDRNIPPQ